MVTYAGKNILEYLENTGRRKHQQHKFHGVKSGREEKILVRVFSKN